MARIKVLFRNRVSTATHYSCKNGPRAVDRRSFPPERAGVARTRSDAGASLSRPEGAVYSVSRSPVRANTARGFSNCGPRVGLSPLYGHRQLHERLSVGLSLTQRKRCVAAPARCQCGQQSDTQPGRLSRDLRRRWPSHHFTAVVPVWTARSHAERSRVGAACGSIAPLGRNRRVPRSRFHNERGRRHSRLTECWLLVTENRRPAQRWLVGKRGDTREW